MRRTGTFGLRTCCRCQLIDSPSRSGSVASSSSDASFRAVLQTPDLLLLVRRHDVVRGEVAVDVHAHPAPGLVLDVLRHLAGRLRKVANVAVAGLDAVVVAQEPGQRLGLGRRLDDDERFRHGLATDSGAAYLSMRFPDPMKRPHPTRWIFPAISSAPSRAQTWAIGHPVAAATSSIEKSSTRGSKASSAQIIGSRPAGPVGGPSGLPQPSSSRTSAADSTSLAPSLSSACAPRCRPELTHPGHRHDVASLLERRPSRNERPALLGGLHHDHGRTEPADDAIAQWEVIGHGGRAGRMLADHGAAFGQASAEVDVLGRIDTVQSGAQDRDAHAAGLERGTMRRRVHAARESAHHDDSGLGKSVRDGTGDLEARPRCGSRAHHRDHSCRRGRGEIAANPQARRRVGNLRKHRRIRGSAERHARLARPHARLSPRDRLRF